MAGGLGRSNSLSINTGASNSLFGASATTSSTTQPQTGGLFSATTTTPQTSNLFGQTASQQQPQQQQPQQQQQGGGLFGATNTSQPQAGGLFGAAPASQPQQTGGLFGSHNKPAQATGGLFGASTAQHQPAQSTGLFGAGTGQNQPQQAGALFGSSQGQQGQQQTGGLFGQQNKPAALSLFSNQTQQQQKPSLFGATAANQPQQQQQVTVPGVTIDLSSVRGTTRFNDLHPDIQARITEMDDYIQKEINRATKVRAAMPAQGERVSYLPPDVDFLQGRLDAVELALDNDSAAVARLKELVKHDADDALLSFRAIENLKLPAQFHYTTGGMGGTTGAGAAAGAGAVTFDGSASADENAPVDLVAYFSGKSDALAKTLTTYQRQITEIEAHLRTVEAGAMQRLEHLMARRNQIGAMGNGDGGGSESGRGRRELVDTLNAIESAILGVAGRVGEAREKVLEVTLGR